MEVWAPEEFAILFVVDWVFETVEDVGDEIAAIEGVLK